MKQIVTCEKLVGAEYKYARIRIRIHKYAPAFYVGLFLLAEWPRPHNPSPKTHEEEFMQQ